MTKAIEFLNRNTINDGFHREYNVPLLVELDTAEQALRIQEKETAEKIFAEIEKAYIVCDCEDQICNYKVDYRKIKQKFLKGKVGK